MSRVLTILGAVIVLVAWVFIAVTVDFGAPNLTQGWAAVPQGFMFGFMLIPNILGHIVLVGVSALV